jgi:hypothetical protein
MHGPQAPAQVSRYSSKTASIPRPPLCMVDPKRRFLMSDQRALKSRGRDYFEKNKRGTMPHSDVIAKRSVKNKIEFTLNNILSLNALVIMGSHTLQATFSFNFY